MQIKFLFPEHRQRQNSSCSFCPPFLYYYFFLHKRKSNTKSCSQWGFGLFSNGDTVSEKTHFLLNFLIFQFYEYNNLHLKTWRNTTKYICMDRYHYRKDFFFCIEPLTLSFSDYTSVKLRSEGSLLCVRIQISDILRCIRMYLDIKGHINCLPTHWVIALKIFI